VARFAAAFFLVSFFFFLFLFFFFLFALFSFDMLYLGLDSSTQSLTAILIEATGARHAVVWQRSLNFDETFPGYGTRHGVLPNADPRVARSSPRMWAEALDRMLGLLVEESGVDLSILAAIAGSGQQHGSVYLAGEQSRLASLDPSRPIADQLDGVFSREESPIWMDSSTAVECEEITHALGGAAALAQLTGSRAFERFTGPQIRRFMKDDPAAYARTGRIHLVSSFLASLLAGHDAPIDPGDGAGMNLMDLAAKKWSAAALDATAPGLAGKLPPIAESWAIAGPLAPYWQRRHGLPAAKVVAWTGDNPSSLVGTGLVEEGHVAISLGTSDTIFGVMDAPRVDRSGTGHVFGAPTGGYMGITVFKNGSLARERVRDAAGLDWAAFARALRESAPGNGGALMLPWFEPEITPTVLMPGVHERGLSAAAPRARVRAVVEGQMMSIARHSRWMGVTVDAIHATGGAAASDEILQVMADVFDAPVRRFEIGNSACLGAALRAWHADAQSSGHPVPWRTVTDAFVRPTGAAIAPSPGARAIYAPLMERQAQFEDDVLGQRR
jgi:xylulokinase